MHLLIMLSLFCQTATGYYPPATNITIDKPVIAVTGQGTSATAVTTAEYEITLYADTTAETESEAKNLAEVMRKDVINAVKELGGKEKDVVLTNISTVPPIETDPYYRVNQDLQVTLRNVKDINKVKEKFLLIGRIQIGTVTPIVKDKLSYEPAIEEARTSAIENAKKEANSLAAGMNVILGEPVYITESITYPYYAGYEAGDNGLLVSVTVWYEMIYKR